MLTRSVVLGRATVVLSQGGSGGESGDGVIPASFNDAMFTGMSEGTAPIFLADGEDISNVSIEEFSGDSTVVFGTGGSMTLCRVNSRECVRISEGTVVIDKCYLEATGQGDDHADTIQIFAIGGSGDVTVTNTHLVAHDTAATAAFLVGDSWSGSISFDNVIFHGGPYSLVVFADPGCTINLSLNNVYFVGPFGFGPFNIEEVGGGIINLTWTNVYEATIVDGVVVPGDPIPSPL